jgi:23S rRNA pseudouridine1911/1915/1917 synthase
MKRKGEWLELAMPGEVAGGAMTTETWLKDRFGMPENMIKQLSGEGGIRTSGNRIRLRLFPEREAGFSPWWHPLDVLFEDDFCLVADKPAGMAVHPDGGASAEGTLAGAVAFHYESTGQRAAVRHIHRLDRMTSGPVLYAKNAFAQAKLDEQMRHKAIERLYVAAVHGIPAGRRGTIRAPIGKDRHVSGKRRVSPGGQAAVTHYELVEAYPAADAALLRLRLETGRTHQVRVHLAHIGHPVIGDGLYGRPDPRIGRQALHGERLRFRHPLTGEMVDISSPLPADFAALLEALRAPSG